jgi:hypothetical protein
MSAATILPHQLTEAEVETMSDEDLIQSVVVTIEIAQDRALTDTDIANFWRVYEEKNRRARTCR